MSASAAGGFLREPDLPGGGGGGFGGRKRGRAAAVLTADDVTAFITEAASGRAAAAAAAGAARGFGASAPSRAIEQPAAGTAARTSVDAGVALQDELTQDDLAALPSDTLAAVQLLRAQFLHAVRGSPDPPLPVVLQAQLYSVVHDRTTVERGVAAEVAAGSLLRVKLASGPDDYALLLPADYDALLERVAAGGAPPAPGATVAEPPLRAALRRFRDVGAPAAASAAGGAWLPSERAASALGGGAAGTACVDELLRAGVLVRDLQPRATGGAGTTGGALWLAIPNSGRLLATLQHGRAAVLAALRRTARRQLRVREAERLRLGLHRARHLPLPPLFFVRDLLGRGDLARARTPAGPLLRLPDDGA